MASIRMINDDEIVNTTIQDLDYVFWLFQRAIELQDREGYKVWSEVDINFLEKDIRNGHQYKILEDLNILCVFSIQFNDAIIWRGRDKNDAVYLHRIVVNPAYRGQKQFQKVLDWTKGFAQKRNLQFIRLDTWADNAKIIDYYKSFGFEWIEDFETPNTTELAPQNRNLNVALLELRL